MSTTSHPQPFSMGPNERERFGSWLSRHKGYSDRVVANQVSRCRRVERELGLSLDASVNTDAGLDTVIDRIREEILTDASDKSRREGQASLIAATRRYAEFLASSSRMEPVAPSAKRGRPARLRPRLVRERTLAATEHSLHSSYREMLLEHLFTGAVMRHLWLKGSGRMELLKPQVDNGGYDLVLEAKRIVRHVQLKASYHGAATAVVNVNVALAEKPSGCVIWIRFDPDSLDLGPFLWFGGAPGAPLPDLAPFKIGRHTKGNAQGVKAKRPNIRIVPVANFERLATIDEVVAHLFGP